jgi:hypothetical protein
LWNADEPLYLRDREDTNVETDGCVVGDRGGARLRRGDRGADSHDGADDGDERALAVGEAVQLEVGCEGAVYLGPFAFASDGQVVTLEGTHTAQAQTCLGASFVDASDAFVAVGGFGCSDGGHTSTAEASYEYSPGTGGNAASPVFVKVAVGDPRPEPCAPSRVTVRRTR